MEQREVTGWAGWAVFAGVMMIMLGMFQALEGLVALFNDDWFVVNKNGLMLSVDYTAWGWVHLIVGVVIVAAGAAVLNGRTWGRLVGMAMAVISALVSLTFIAAYPAWSIIIIAIDVFVIYALCVHGDELGRRVTERSKVTPAEAPPEPQVDALEHPKGLKARYTSTRDRVIDAERSLRQSRPQRPWVNLGYCVIERDLERGGGLIAGALAYRIFFWVLPFTLVFVGAIGFAASADEKAPQDIAKAGGVVGLAAQSISQAAADSSSFRWWAIIIGLPALYLAGVSFVKALRVAHGLLWGVPPGRMRHKPLAAVLMTLVLIGVMAALALENRIRDASKGPGLIAAMFFIVIVAALWLFVAYHMPRPEGTTWLHIVPGSVAVAAGGQIVHLVTVYYVSRKVSGASSTYGALGAAAGILLSLFFLARVVVLGTVLNAELWARRETRRTGEAEPEVQSPLILDQ